MLHIYTRDDINTKKCLETKRKDADYTQVVADYPGNANKSLSVLKISAHLSKIHSTIITLIRRARSQSYGSLIRPTSKNTT